MKTLKILLISGLWLLLATSCSQLDEQPTSVAKPQQKISEIITPSEAISIASAYAPILLKESLTRGLTARVAYEAHPVSIMDIEPNRGDIDKDTLFYIVNYTNDEGFAFVAAKRGGVELLAISDSGNYKIEDTNQNPGVSLFVTKMVDYFNRQDEGNNLGGEWNPGTDPTRPMEHRQETQRIITSYINPRVLSKWGQTGFFGIYCPNQTAGCVPVAIGQTLTSLQTPSSINLTFPFAPTSTIQLEWDSLYYHNFSWNLSSVCNSNNPSCQRDHQTIGLLLRQIGHLCNADYSERGSTGVRLSDIPNAINSIPHVTMSSFYNFPTVDYQIVNAVRGNILLLSGGTHSTSIDGSDILSYHTWLADGYKVVKTINTYWFRYQGDT